MFALLITAAASTMTPTLDTAPRRINVDGVRATYTRTVDADGTVHLKGVYLDSGRTRFHYTVRGDQVEGRVGSAALTFKRPGAR
jgi:hypothetical protein